MENREERLEIIERGGATLSGTGLVISTTTILRCNCGAAKLVINGNSHFFVAETNFIVLESNYISIEECTDDFNFTSIIFGRRILNQIYPYFDTTMVGSLLLSYPDVAPIEEYQYAELTLEKMIKLEKSENQNKKVIMGHLIFCYIYEMYELVKNGVKRNSTISSNHLNSLISRFIVLCQENHTIHRELSFYCEMLSISRRYLHEIAMSKLQLSPKQFIDNYVVATAKQMLLGSNMSTQQVADKLNFSDQSAFGQFFRRLTGVSPTKFRKDFLKK